MFHMMLHIEDIVAEACRVSGSDEWDEDHLTRAILKGLRTQLQGQSFRFGDTTKFVHWYPYKQKKKSDEHNFGDLAIVVTIEYKNNKPLRGVAFLEAKRIYDSNKFDALKTSQLTRINAHAPHAQLLMYDTQLIENYRTDGIFGYSPEPFLRRTHAATAPINTVLAFGENDRSLYRFATPFSCQLVGRYFFGLDLEFTDKALAIATGIDQEVGAPQFLLITSIGYSESRDDPPSGFDLSNYNPL